MRGVLRVVGALIFVGQAFWVAMSLYQSAIALTGRVRRVPRRAVPGVKPCFFLIVCARNEAAVIPGIVSDLLAQNYPRDRFEVIVVAHNCTDATARVAAQAGVRVVELETERPGKAVAVSAGLNAAGDACDFVGVFDADARAPRGLLAAVAEASPGEDCLQVETVPRDTGEWLVEGYGLGRRVRNALWWRPREALGLGTTISGCGFFIRPALLREHLPKVRTLTEDLELTARLYNAGRRVAYVSSSFVVVEEPHRLGASVQQRARWARGHLRVVVHGWPPMFARGLRGDLRAFDMALYLISPTRMLTRLAVSCSFALALLRLPFALPLAPVALALSGEWLLPLYVAVRDRLVPMSVPGLMLAGRHALLNLLWFPIGLWALVTPKSRAWTEMPRSTPEEPDANAAA
jgi:hypothetical protein